jgi:exopolysaccharide biosynthesis polyprenyl glycosylphosphotransferase
MLESGFGHGPTGLETGSPAAKTAGLVDVRPEPESGASREGPSTRGALRVGVGGAASPSASELRRGSRRNGVQGRPRRRVVAADRQVRLALLVADLGVVGASYALGGRPPASWVYATVPLWSFSLLFFGAYDFLRAGAEDARRLLAGVIVASAAVLLVVHLGGAGVQPGWLGRVLAEIVVLGAVVRVGARRVVAALQARGLLERRVLVVGANAEALALGRSLGRQAWGGCELVGFVDPGLTSTGEAGSSGRPATRGGAGPQANAPGPVLCGLDGLADAVRATRADVVLVASTALQPGDVATVCRTLHALGVEVRLSTGLPQVAVARMSLECLDGAGVLVVRQSHLSAHQAALKRAVDVVGSVLLLVLCAPLLLALALVVRVTSGPGVLFRQVRVGEGGKAFTIYKFRTMVPGAEERVVDLKDRNQADGLLFKVFDDPRVTGVGRVLRRWGLDELPQLWNVLKGEMSLVGPRPPLPDETARYDEWVRGRLKVKPGITGLWQVNGRHELSFDDYVRYDLFYVENWSLALDLAVLFRTIPALIAQRGAY